MVQKLVNVSVANLYREPTFRSENTTQALLGERVELLEYHEGFSLIRTSDRYQNWVDELQLCDPQLFPDWWVTARSHHFLIYSEPDTASPKIRDAVIGCKLACLSKQNEWLQVILPDGATGWAQAKHFGTFPSLSRETVVALAMEFIGYPYSWGGKSPKGLDCSGFVQLVFSLLKRPVFRDAWMQFGESRMISENVSDAEPGDLYFFGENRDIATHVGIALGNCKLVHSSGMIRINSLNSSDSNYYGKIAKNFLAVKTFFGSS